MVRVFAYGKRLVRRVSLACDVRAKCQRPLSVGGMDAKCLPSFRVHSRFLLKQNILNLKHKQKTSQVATRADQNKNDAFKSYITSSFVFFFFGAN